jgi:DNA-binding NtrC family response regulator
MDALRAHAWPGNVRELAHAVERAVILSREPLIGPDAFGLFIGERRNGSSAGSGVAGGRRVASPDAVTLPSLNISEAEKFLIDSALAAAANNRTKAAKLLGISVRTLRNKLNRPEE